MIHTKFVRAFLVYLTENKVMSPYATLAYLFMLVTENLQLIKGNLPKMNYYTYVICM